MDMSRNSSPDFIRRENHRVLLYQKKAVKKMTLKNCAKTFIKPDDEGGEVFIDTGDCFLFVSLRFQVQLTFTPVACGPSTQLYQHSQLEIIKISASIFLLSIILKSTNSYERRANHNIPVN